jgi:hypothetical protein
MMWITYIGSGSKNKLKKEKTKKMERNSRWKDKEDKEELLNTSLRC